MARYSVLGAMAIAATAFAPMIAAPAHAETLTLLGNSVPITHVFMIHPHNGARFLVQHMQGMQKVEVLVRNTYRRQFLDGLGGKEGNFELCVELARSTEMLRIARPADQFRANDMRDVVLDLLRLHPGS